MCIFNDENGVSGTSRRRRLAGMGIVLIGMSLAIGLLHPTPGPDANFFDFLRGVTVGIGLVFSATAFMLCARRMGSHG
jgi:hypothetical protein